MTARASYILAAAVTTTGAATTHPTWLGSALIAAGLAALGWAATRNRKEAP